MTRPAKEATTGTMERVSPLEGLCATIIGVAIVILIIFGAFRLGPERGSCFTSIRRWRTLATPAETVQTVCMFRDSTVVWNRP